MPEENNRQIESRTAPLTGLVPMLPVLDVERSAAFYKLLGFAVGNRVPRTGLMQWAWLYAPNVPDWRRGPNLMLTRREGAGEPGRKQCCSTSTPPISWRCGRNYSWPDNPRDPFGIPTTCPRASSNSKTRMDIASCSPKTTTTHPDVVCISGGPICPRPCNPALAAPRPRRVRSALRPPSGGLQPFRNRQRPPGTLHARPHAPGSVEDQRGGWPSNIVSRAPSPSGS